MHIKYEFITTKTRHVQVTNSKEYYESTRKTT